MLPLPNEKAQLLASQCHNAAMKDNIVKVSHGIPGLITLPSESINGYYSIRPVGGGGVQGVQMHSPPPPIQLVMHKTTFEPQTIPVSKEHLRTQHFIDYSLIVIMLVSSPYDHTLFRRDHLGTRLFLYRMQLLRLRETWLLALLGTCKLIPLVPVQRVTATLLLDKQSPLTLTIRKSLSSECSSQVENNN